MRASTIQANAENLRPAILPRGFSRWACVAAKVGHMEGFTQFMRLIAELGMDVDAFDFNAQSPAMSCARHGFGEGMALCVKLGADLDKPGRGGKSARQLARSALEAHAEQKAKGYPGRPLWFRNTDAPRALHRQMDLLESALQSDEIAISVVEPSEQGPSIRI